MKNILVTGGAGYIGSHTVVELMQEGYRPVIIDNLENSEAEVIEGIKEIAGQELVFYEGNYQDDKLLNKVLTEQEISGVIHFAAHKSVGESVSKPLKYYQNNVAGLIRLLVIMNERGVKNLVFSSSCTVYGEPDSLPITENAPIKPAESPYGATKQMGEEIIENSSKAKAVKAISLRYFNPIGAHPSSRIGELPKGTPSNLVPFMTQVVAKLRDELVIFGNDYPTVDGTSIRDYIHVVDLAKAHISALNLLGSKTTGYYDVFNIGTGRGKSVMEVVKTFEKATGQKVNYRFGPRRKGDIVSTYASAEKAKQQLGWVAKKTIDQALNDAWNWQNSLAIKKQNG